MDEKELNFFFLLRFLDICLSSLLLPHPARQLIFRREKFSSKKGAGNAQSALRTMCMNPSNSVGKPALNLVTRGFALAGQP